MQYLSTYKKYRYISFQWHYWIILEQPPLHQDYNSLADMAAAEGTRSGASAASSERTAAAEVITEEPQPPLSSSNLSSAWSCAVLWGPERNAIKILQKQLLQRNICCLSTIISVKLFSSRLHINCFVITIYEAHFTGVTFNQTMSNGRKLEETHSNASSSQNDPIICLLQ